MEMEKRCNKSIIYWKWDDSTLASDITDKIEDLCNRTDIHQVCIGLHWIKRPFADRELISFLELCSRELHKRGKKLFIEACPRNEGASFFEKYPEDIAYLTTATEINLDENGQGEAEVETPIIPHYWRTAKQLKPILIAAYSLHKREEGYFIEGSQKQLWNTIKLMAGSENNTIVKIDAGREEGNRTAVVFVGIPQPIPDLASQHLIPFYKEMLKEIKDIGIDGVMSDEWGYDVILGVEDRQSSEGKKQEIYFQHVTYSENFALRYHEISQDNLAEDLLYFYYQEEGNREKNIRKVNNYHDTFRDIMRRNDEEMYHSAKQLLGENTFYGVHPTWWGNNYLQNFEGFKNGFYWWEAKRDIAQTDEIVIMPIRTALAHKWSSSYWYNMWYSMGTRDINTYYRETWNNVRFGGRTHYLSYECPNEAVVLELKPVGLLDSIEEMDKVLRKIDSFQKAAPDCRVLFLFGMENALNWYYNEKPTPPWYSRHKVLSALLECTDQVFAEYLCDLVPTSEIENKSLTIENGKPRYGTQTYDAVVLLAPDSMGKACYEFIGDLDASRLIVAGEVKEYKDGTGITEDDNDVLKQGIYYEDLFVPQEIIETLERWNIKKNRFSNGCVLQDGSLIFTAQGDKAIHNPLKVYESYGELSIDFEGEDMLYLHHLGDDYQPIYTSGNLKLSKK